MCFLVFVHTETCISEFVCVCVCMSPVSRSGKEIAEGDKQTHLTLCPHGNQGTEQKRDGGRDRKPERGDANRCSGMKREEE